MARTRVLILGAAGRDFHDFNVRFRSDERVEVVAFTATRWGTLLKPYADWPGQLPTASDCYRYCLAEPAVQLVLTAPRSLVELEQNLEALESPRMSKKECAQWQRFGDLVYSQGKGRFEMS